MLEEYREKKLEVIEALGALGDLAGEVGAKSLRERIEKDLVAKLQADRFHLVVVGEFNHGKTTFVNALLGGPVLPVGVTPTTAVIHHLIWGETPAARVVLASGEERPLDFAEVSSFTAGGAHAADPVSYLEVQYPAELLRERLVLVDTPGVNDLSLTRAEITYGYIPRSDAVLFVLDAGQPVKESERVFLQQQLIGRSREKIVFVVAKRDIWSEPEQGEALAYIRERLAELVPSPAVFPVSAVAALRGEANESGLPELTRHLTEFLSEQRGKIVLENALGEGAAAAGVVARGIDARRRAATLSTEQLAKRVQLLEQDLRGHAGTIADRRMTIREEAGAIKAWARRDLDRFCDDVVAQLPTALEKVSGDDIRRHLGAFLEQSFREWAHAETQEIASALEGLAERTVAMIREDAREVGKRVGEAMGGDLRTPSVEIDTFAQDVGVFAVLSLGLSMLFANALLGGILLVAAPALALYNRGRMEAAVKKRALEVAPSALREAAAKVAPKIDEMVDDFTARLDRWVVETGEELHREVIEVLASVERARAASAPSAEAEMAACDAASARLSELVGRIGRLRSQIGPPPAESAAAEVSRVVEKAAAGSNGAGRPGGVEEPS